MLSVICAWLNGWVNTRKAGDLRRHRTHYGVTVMQMFSRDAAVNAVVLGQTGNSPLFKLMMAWFTDAHMRHPALMI